MDRRLAAVERHPATVAAVQDSRFLVIPVDRVLPRPGAPVSPVHLRFIHNMVCEVGETAWRLRFRAFILSRRSTTGRLMAYLRAKMRAEGSNDFTIPFDRQGLADYLCVDRSALSSVLGRLARKGVLDYHKNHFVLHGPAGEFE